MQFKTTTKTKKNAIHFHHCDGYGKEIILVCMYVCCDKVNLMYYILGDIAPRNVSIPLNATKSKYFMYKVSNIMCILKMDSQPLSEFLSGLHESIEKKVAAMYNLSFRQASFSVSNGIAC